MVHEFVVYIVEIALNNHSDSCTHSITMDVLKCKYACLFVGDLWNLWSYLSFKTMVCVLTDKSTVPQTKYRSGQLYG